jgi:hypothetical protein
MISRLSFKNRVVKPYLFSKSFNKHLLSSGNEIAWFEFVINGAIITSADPIWKYISHQVRQVNNGGEEVKIIIGATKKISGVRLEIYRQYFPKSTLIRERLVLQSKGKSFKLNKLNGKLHFVFPKYSLATDTSADEMEEIRIATFNKELLPDYDPNHTYDDRKYDNARDFNLAHAHMFHPQKMRQVLKSGDSTIIKGPFGVYKTGKLKWLSAYEHASQDKTFAAEADEKRSGAIAVDAQQGVSSQGSLSISDDDFWFLGFKSVKHTGSLVVSLEQLLGGYLDGELFDDIHPYETVWSVCSFIPADAEIAPVIHNYLWSQISEHPNSRKSHYYYNTWGMQRDANNRIGLREIFTESRILTEIRNAAELKVDLFVLDDGWEQTMGVWQPHDKRLPNGLKPLIDEMKRHNITPGIWLSPMGIDSSSERYKNHDAWIIKGEDGQPIKGQWGFPVMDFVGGFYKVFVQDCKNLVDSGIRFFKWDAINTFNSTLPGLHHGTSLNTKQEIRDRYAYLLPFYITRAMKELREYNPEVVIEIDLTEKQRAIIGLMPLAEGKFFLMNNGASGYNDYSQYRTKSMRTVLNEYAGVIPTELFTHAVYPHNEYPFFAQRYSVNTSLVGGRGFWGNLDMMKTEQRIRVGNLVEKSKLVLPYIIHLPVKVSAMVGASPEIYTHVNKEKAAGQVIAFSGSPCSAPVSVSINTENCLGVLNHAFSLDSGTVHLPFQFDRPDDTNEAFIVSNDGNGIGIESATGWIDALELDVFAKRLTIVSANESTIILRVPMSFKKLVSNGIPLHFRREDNNRFSYYALNLNQLKPVVISWE